MVCTDDKPAGTRPTATTDLLQVVGSELQNPEQCMHIVKHSDLFKELEHRFAIFIIILFGWLNKCYGRKYYILGALLNDENARESIIT